MKKIFIILFTVLFLGSLKIAYTQVVDKNEVVQKIPTGYSLAYLVKDTLKVPTYYVVLEPTNDENYYSNFKIFSGHQGEVLNEEKILEPVTRYRDGGTTVIYSGIGIFYFPTPLDRKLHPTLTISEKENRLIKIKKP